MQLLRLDSSVRTDASVSRSLADAAEQAWRAEHPDGTVVRRDLGRSPLPTETWGRRRPGHHDGRRADG